MRSRLMAVLAGWLCTASVMAADKPAYESDLQKFSYTLGYQIGLGLKQDSAEVDLKVLTEGIQDVLGNAKPRLTEEQMRAAVSAHQQKKAQQREALGKQNLKTGQAFLAENQKKKGVVKLPSGLQYRVIRKGKGKKPALSDTVVAHYRGRLLNGREFDSSYRRGEPETFPLKQVIRGWQEAVQLMQPGAKWEVFVPAALGYGMRGTGGSIIGPNETLIFEIELLEIK